jgi:superfamily II DNA or RNA helicase
VKRVLVVAPKGVQLQWRSELSAHFDEAFVLVGPGGVPVDAGIDPWTQFSQVICSTDSVKPLVARRGWSPERVARHNDLRYLGLVRAGWDLIIIDEAHHVGGSSEDVARHQLAVELAGAAPHLLLLSATPHSGKSDAFARLLGLLDTRFSHGRALNRANVAPLIVRCEKRQATDLRGRPLFTPRTTRLVVVPYGARAVEQQLYDAVTVYVTFGYRRAKAERRPAIAFLVLLMQRLVSSSTRAVLSALQRRHAAIIDEGTQLTLFSESSEEWGDLSGEEQVEALGAALGRAWGDELAEVEVLIDLARQAGSGIDAKARALLALIEQQGREEGAPGLKVVVFTEFTQTQDMLLDLLQNTGIVAVGINGTLGVHERAAVQEEFRAGPPRVLVSTDAGGEGVNLQFAHVVVNYDLPWSPARIEQRIGRVDRIGQTHPVKAFNLTMEHSVDARVLEVLELKLSIIRRELGADKAHDVLNGAERHVGELYEAAVASDDFEAASDTFTSETRDDVIAAVSLTDLTEPSPRRSSLSVGDDPRRWLDQARAARARITAGTGNHADAQRVPEVSPEEPIPVVRGSRSGTLSVWEVGDDAGRSCTALFLTEDTTMRPDIAERIWEAIAGSCELVAVETADPDLWRTTWQAGRDYAARADATGSRPASLTLRLLLLVRA